MTAQQQTPSSSPVQPQEEDHTHTQLWFFEHPRTSPQKVITPQGVENIANHKYVPGTYTVLDNILNPMWTYLTSLLPMWLAPNMVTTIGGFHCFLSYVILCYYSPDMTPTPIPSWVFILTGYNQIVYYTFDCMDGKQSRRTGTSSPLGQLFDHGFDCICNISHIAVSSGYLGSGGSKGFLVMQISLQVAFFCAQWEEYYTRVLPHAVGGFMGVTETNYTIALISIFNAFIDREGYWGGAPFPNTPYLSTLLANIERRDTVYFWYFIIICILLWFSVIRVVKHISNPSVLRGALKKFVSPVLMSVAPFLLPSEVIATHSRWVSLSVGLLFTLLTKKLIVFSMAKMAYAAVQFDAVLFLVVCLYVRFFDEVAVYGDLSSVTFCFVGTTIFYACRLVWWCRLAILQITERLDIYCFTIKKKTA